MNQGRRIITTAALALAALSGAAGGAQAAEAIGGGNSTAAKRCQQGGWQGLVTFTGQPLSSQGACVVYAVEGGSLSARSTSSLVFELGTCTPDSVESLVCPTSSLVGYGLMPHADIVFCERAPGEEDVCHGIDAVEEDGTVPDRFASSRSDCVIGVVYTFYTSTAAGTRIADSDTCEARAPRAVGNAYMVDLGASLVVSAPGVLRNDSGPDGDVLRAVLVSGPAHGRLTLNADGSLRYTPSEDFIGVDSFTYRASDGTHQSAAATVRITVRAVCGGMAATKVGTSAANTITGTSGADVIVGLGGNDTIRGLAGNDRVCGGSGADSISAGAGADVLIGGSGNDVLRGEPGNDGCSAAREQTCCSAAPATTISTAGRTHPTAATAARAATPPQAAASRSPARTGSHQPTSGAGNRPRVSAPDVFCTRAFT